MIRVAFVLRNSGDGWLGGFNYFRNLLSAIALLPDRRIQPVVFLGTRDSGDICRGIDQIEVARSKWFDGRSVAGLLRSALDNLSGFGNAGLGLVLNRHGIDVLSHFGSLGRASRIKSIGWIADFQHLRLPEYFCAKDIARRNALFGKWARECDRIVVSSEVAKRDFEAFAPEAAEKCRVLHFVPDIGQQDSFLPLSYLEGKYAFSGPYFLLPNQFFMHKNHSVVINALGVLQGLGLRPTVLATGKGHDHRNPGHFGDLVKRIERLNLASEFRFLGVIPIEELRSLMHHAAAVINPSLFEGWSSTVEEAKALGKLIVLSDIDVHREQNPRRALFFDPRSPEDLAQRLREVISGDNWTRGAGSESMDVIEHKARRIAFARQFEGIVCDLYSKPSMLAQGASDR